MRIGLGYDIHQLSKNRKFIIGGETIPFESGLLGHSDADVLVHSIIDALLGALALRDIGFHFPDTDEKYKDANSMLLLKKTNELIKDKGYKVINIDSNIVCQKPKFSPFIDNMRKNISTALDIDFDCVSIKAKTNEKMDSIGDGKSVASWAVVLLDKI